MPSVIMSHLNGDKELVAFDTEDILQIIKSSEVKMVSTEKEPGVFLELDDRIYPVKVWSRENDIKPYFILHRSGDAYNVGDYQLLFNVQQRPDDLISGMDVTGRAHQCKRHEKDTPGMTSLETLTGVEVRQEEKATGPSTVELRELRAMIKKLKNGEFFEALTVEFSGKIKEIAQELIEFRRDLQSRLNPELVDIAEKDIPEASYHLEGINQTLESSTMKIMDINEEQLDLANKQLERLSALVPENDKAGGISDGTMKVVEKEMEVLKRIAGLSMSMIEPLSFQDLVGQRIQRIIRLVKSMETRIADLIISFGIKIQRHKEDPDRSFDDLRRDVEDYKSDLKGPQNEGEGLAQNDIDELLATL